MQILPNNYLAAFSNYQSFIQTLCFLMTPLFLFSLSKSYFLNECTVKPLKFTDTLISHRGCSAREVLSWAEKFFGAAV